MEAHRKEIQQLMDKKVDQMVVFFIFFSIKTRNILFSRLSIMVRYCINHRERSTSYELCMNFELYLKLKELELEN